jgi:dephospho-CoA kinase
MIKVLAIGGEPCSGKTTLVKRFIKESGLQFKKKRVNKLLDLLHDEENGVYILGLYEDSIGTFQGTDKLSMAVQPDAVDFFNSIDSGTVIFEGDRLFNNKMLDYLSDKFGERFKVLVLSASDEVLEERHTSRNDNQDDKFKTSRKTKVNNIITNLNLMDHINVLKNNTEPEREIVYKFVKEFVAG